MRRAFTSTSASGNTDKPGGALRRKHSATRDQKPVGSAGQRSLSEFWAVPGPSEDTQPKAPLQTSILSWSRLLPHQIGDPKSLTERETLSAQNWESVVLPVGSTAIINRARTSVLCRAPHGAEDLVCLSDDADNVASKNSDRPDDNDSSDSNGDDKLVDDPLFHHLHEAKRPNQEDTGNAISLRSKQTVRIDDDGSDDLVVVLDPGSVCATTQNWNSSSPPRQPRTCTRASKALDSSPSLLRPSSPTVIQFNDSWAQLSVDPNNDDDLEYSQLAPPSSPPRPSQLIGSTSADHSRILTSNSEDLAYPGAPERIPETPPERTPTIGDNPIAAAAVASGKKDHNSKLSSDPIGEFDTPITSPIKAQGAVVDNRIRSLLGTPDGVDNICTYKMTDPLSAIDSDAEDMEGTSITQWYRTNLHGSDQGEENQKEEASDSDGCLANADSCNSRSPTPFSVESDQESIIGRYTIDCDESPTSNSIDSASAGGKCNENTTEKTDDGYSSPLEGFWSLRKEGDDPAGHSGAVGVYYDQFQPSAAQLAARARAGERCSAGTSSGNMPRLDPAEQANSNRSAPRTNTSKRKRVANSRKTSRSSSAVATRTRTRGKGKQVDIQTEKRSRKRSRATRGKKASGLIRPMYPTRHSGEGNSSRPFPAASVSTRPGSKPPKRQNKTAPAATPAYNYYADDPHLDIARYMNWEGGGMSKFG